eukprot:4336257-Pleurochrysis_carterae.AAC.1
MKDNSHVAFRAHEYLVANEQQPALFCLNWCDGKRRPLPRGGRSTRGRVRTRACSGSADESTVLVYGCADSFKKSKQLAGAVEAGR